MMVCVVTIEAMAHGIIFQAKKNQLLQQETQRIAECDHGTLRKVLSPEEKKNLLQNVNVWLLIKEGAPGQGEGRGSCF